MGIDAVALLRIASLAAPATPFGALLVDHRGDATLVHMFTRFDAADPDEHALLLRSLLGDALDAHDDPRGVLFFADILEPKGASYDAIVSELTARGCEAWAPKVDADYVLLRYRGAPREPHDALVGELIGAMGRDAALQLDMLAQVNKAVCETDPERLPAAATHRAQIEAVARSLGDDFAQRYEASLEARVDAMPMHRRPMSLELPVSSPEPPPISLEPPSPLPLGVLAIEEVAPEGLIDEMISVMGRDAAHERARTAFDARIALAISPDDPDAADKVRAEIDAIARAMGADFARRYETGLDAKVDPYVTLLARFR